MSELIIILDKPIRVSHKGDLVEVEVLNISLPTVQYYNLYASVKEVVLTAMLAMQDKITTDITVDEINKGDDDEKYPLDLFLADGSLMKLSKAVNSYLGKCAKFDDFQVNDNMLKKLSIKDYNNILERVSYFLYEN